MSNAVLLDRPQPVATRATDRMSWDATHLRVRDLDRSLGFWRDVLGLQVRRSSPDEVALGVEDAELVVLHPGARRPALRGHTGLYHVALHLPMARDFAEMFLRLGSRGVESHPTDHLLHWAMYVSDFDGIGVELSFETADRFDRVIPGRRAMLARTDGGRQGPVERLDMRSVLDAFEGLDADPAMPRGTRIGHNHLHVADLASSARFYERLGFVANPSFMGLRDFNAHGSFPHRLAINEWQGHGAPPAPDDAAGLHHLQLSYADRGVFADAMSDAVRSELLASDADRGPEAVVTDPSGNVIVLRGPVP